ncbi:complement C1q tumor necrosis factor-related protein 6-like [Limanda limanda]|uniref:complement C1q tumor necrosis factor-related protein 6-like n=1 Tax=Limanda limanda TaxID=27771 RepID=UPI0029C7AD5C|nr:complement C1q tumor necrosis factor-related protein 6-like [Limanda limanda]
MQTNRNSPKMKTLMVVLGLSLFTLCVAEVMQLIKRGEAVSSFKSPSIESACHCESKNPIGYILKPFEKLEDKQRFPEMIQEIEDPRNQLQRNQVAFGVAIGNVGNIGPYNREITLTYKTIFANTGSYNPDKGIFSAPVQGMYYFSFSGHNQSQKPMGLRLMKNGEQIVTVSNDKSGEDHETATNGMTIHLNVGDQVYVTLRENMWIFDDDNNHCTFIGHLLFPFREKINSRGRREGQ